MTWDDPRTGAETSENLAGMDYVRAVDRVHIPPPPTARILGSRRKRVDVIQAVFELQPGEDHDNPIGMVQGGVASKKMTRG